MDFDALVTAELTALASRLAEAARAGRDAAAEEAEQRAQTRAEVEIARVRTEANALAEQLRAETEAALERIQRDAAAAIASAQTDAASMAADRDAALEQLRAEAAANLQQVIAERDAAIAQARFEAEGDGSRLRTELAAETARVRQMADAAIAEAQALAQLEIAQAQMALDVSVARAQAAETELVAIRAAASTATKTSSTFGAMIEKLRDRQAELAAENERLAAENAAFSYERQEWLEATSKAARPAAVIDLAGTFERVAAAATVDDVLGSAVDGVSQRLARVALFAVRDTRLLPIAHRGFDANSGLDKVVVPLGVDSFLSTAAQATDLRVLRDDRQAATPFGGSPQFVLTAPITVRGELMALLYADDSGATLDARDADDSLALVRVALAYTALRLERLTLELKATAELRAYAQMLVDEAEYMHQADLSARRPDTERVQRLAENLRCAHQIYRQRVTLEGPAAAALLDDVLRDLMAAKAATPFGRDLQDAVAGSADVSDHRTAQAS
jgi:hypothetical protein